MRVECKQCGIEFETNKELEEHEINEHNFGCEHCEKTFQVKWLLEEHISNYHKIQPRALVQCPHCAKIFRANKLLNQHIKRKHIATNGLQNCSICGKIFKNASALANHFKNAHNENESSDDDFEKALSLNEACSVAQNAGKNVEVYNEESSPDDEKMTNENGEVANEGKTEESLEEEKTRLSMMQERLKLVKMGKTVLEQVNVLNKNEESEYVNKSQKVAALVTIKSTLVHGRNNLSSADTTTSKISRPILLESGEGKPTDSINAQFAKVADQIKKRVEKGRQLESMQKLTRLPSSSKDFLSKQTDSPEQYSVQNGEHLKQEKKQDGVKEENQTATQLDPKTIVPISIDREQNLDQMVLATGGSAEASKEFQGSSCEICRFMSELRRKCLAT